MAKPSRSKDSKASQPRAQQHTACYRDRHKVGGPVHGRSVQSGHPARRSTHETWVCRLGEALLLLLLLLQGGINPSLT